MDARLSRVQSYLLVSPFHAEWSRWMRESSAKVYCGRATRVSAHSIQVLHAGPPSSQMIGRGVLGRAGGLTLALLHTGMGAQKPSP